MAGRGMAPRARRALVGGTSVFALAFIFALAPVQALAVTRGPRGVS